MKLGDARIGSDVSVRAMDTEGSSLIHGRVGERQQLVMPGGMFLVSGVRINERTLDLRGARRPQVRRDIGLVWAVRSSTMSMAMRRRARVPWRRRMVVQEMGTFRVIFAIWEDGGRKEKVQEDEECETECHDAEQRTAKECRSVMKHSMGQRGEPAKGHTAERRQRETV